MPEIIESEGVEFKVNNKPDEYNYIRCDGQTITLPETHGGGKLYLLVTSSNGNKKTTFDVDGKQYAFNIPYYSGFYGQWGWKGESEGYMHDASIAYLGTHRHNGKVGNESYTYTYLYKIAIDIDKNARTLKLPKNQSIALFAVTLSDNPNADTKSVHEMRALPHITKNIIYE
jgi:alpha-mannosidase